MSEVNAWGPNTWKTRYTLNIKGIPYKTVWVEFADIEPISKKIGAAPTSTKPDGSPFYTCPFIYDPNTRIAVSDSVAIARYLDKTYPDTHPLVPKATAALQQAFLRAFEAEILPGKGELFALMMPQSHARLNERSQPYFRRTREAVLGQSLEEAAPRGSEKAKRLWEGVRSGFHAVAEWLKRAEDGGKELFFGGEGIVFADTVVAAFLTWIRLAFGEESEEWKGVLSWDGGRWGKFAEAFRKYEAVDAGSYYAEV
ncbi:hypothetical protein L226DRAFT_458357 [Lentinus tigrinus ALCF2SS1-7]|nr:hypothetical protein L226DRAFT_458357 [Lentinus tigrinus ALCF2SS1-7]